MVSKKKQLFTRFIAMVLSVIILISPVYADVLIDYNGSTNTGGSQGGGTNKSGFLIPSADKNSDLIYGYRFSIWDENGNKKVSTDGKDSKTIDIFIKSTTLGTLDYRGGIVRQGARAQTSKKEWAVNYGVTVMDATSFSDIRQVESPSFETALPSGADVTKEKLEEWITNKTNRKTLYIACGLKSSAIKSTDYVLVEPLVAIKLDNKGLIVTPTDIAMVGVRIYGVDYNGRNVEITYGTLGYLASYVNGIYPNFMMAPETMIGIVGANGIAVVPGVIKKDGVIIATFNSVKNGDIVKSGYGCNIVSLRTIVPPYVTPSVSITPVTLYGETTTSSGTRVQDQLQAQLNSGVAYSGELLSYYVHYTNNGDEDSTFILNDAAKENNRDGGAVNRQHYSDKEMWIGKKSSHVCSPWESDSTYRNTQWRSKNTTQDGTIDYTASIKYKADGNYNASASKQVKVVKTDLAVQEIQVYRNGSRLTNEQYQTLRCGDNIEVRYVYKNNTDAKVYARMDWYKNDNREEDSKTAIISANAEYTVSVPMTVGDLRYNHDSVQNGRLYLFARITIADLSFDESSWYGTNYESNGSNNVLDLSIVFQTPLAGEFIQPNSTYRRGTEIVASFSVWNTTAFGLLLPETPTNDSKNMCVGIVPILKITGANGYEETITPSPNRTLPPANLSANTVSPTTMWYKWKIPEDFEGDTATLTLYIDYGNNFAKTSLQKDIPVAGGGTRSNKPIVTATVEITDKLQVQTPDTAWSTKRPEWYRGLSTKNVLNGKTDVRSSSLYTDDVKANTSWSYWVYRNNKFEQVTESANLQTAAWIGVADKYVMGHKYNMRSGYGIQLKASGTVFSTGKTKESCTVSQSGFVFFPEFMYAGSTDSIRDRYNKLAQYYLKQSSRAYEDLTGFKRIPMTEDGKFKPDTTNNGVYGTFASLSPIQFSTDMQLPINTTSLTNTHYTPLWTPDGDYKVLAYLSDAWTPGGMLSGYTFSNTITIDGDMLDDYTVAVYGDY